METQENNTSLEPTDGNAFADGASIADGNQSSTGAPDQPRAAIPAHINCPLCAATGAFFKSKQGFFYTFRYAALVSAFIFLCWLFKWEAVGVVLLIVGVSVYAALKRDLLPVVPVLFMLPMIFPREIDPMNYKAAMYFALALPVGLIIHFVRFPVKPHLGKMFFPYLAVSVATLTAGIGSISVDGYANGLLYAVALGLLQFVCYFIVYNYAFPPESVDLKKYLSAILLFTGMLIVAQVLTFYIRQPQKLYAIGDRVSLGWGVGNNFSTILLFCVSASFYLARVSKRPFIYILLAAVQYLAIVFSWSRGATLAAAVIFPFFIFFTLFKAKGNAKQLYISFSLIAAILLVAFAFLAEDIIRIIKDILAQGTGNSGRTELYTEAWNCFKQNPVFGAGISFDGVYYHKRFFPMYWFHSTFFQILGSLGIIGLAAYGYMYFMRYKLIIKKDFFNILMFVGLFGYEFYCMFDTGTFIPVPMVLEVTFITLFIELINKNKADKPEVLINAAAAPQSRRVRIKWKK